jgi:hypothetical protein
MKKTLIVILICLPTIIVGQIEKQKTISKLIISDATENGKDITEYILDQQAYLAFYTVDDTDKENLCMANVWAKNNSNSYGRVFDKNYHKSEATSSEFEIHIMSFKWSYQNTYDDKRGTANVELLIIHKPIGKAFIITIIPENLDVLQYKGYIDGSLDLNKYSN